MNNVLSSLKITTLGQFSILRGLEPLRGGNWNRRRVCEIFKILLSAEQHRLHREQMQEMLWPDFTMDQAANSFGKTVYLLRRAFEPDLTSGRPSAYVALDHDALLLVPGSMEIDADIFEAMARQMHINLHSATIDEQQVEGTLNEFDRVLALYAGDYLPDDLYEEWAQRRRDRLHRVHSWLLEHAAKLAVAGKQGERASEYLRALLDQNAADEQTHRELMLIYARLGRRSEALNQYQLLREALRDELGTSPLPETIELYQTIQSGSISVDLAPPVPLRTRKSTSYQLPPVSENSLTHEEPAGSSILYPEAEEAISASSRLDPLLVLNAELVGRASELQRLRQAYMWVREGQPRVFFVSGEAGIGKTRLSQELRLWTQQQQATVLQGNGYEMGGALPYQPIIDMLTMDCRTRSPEQLRSIAGSSLVDLVKIVPALRLKFPDLPAPEQLGPEVERRNLYSAVADYFSVLAARSPLLLLLDDLQWADIATMQLLSYLLTRPVDYSTQQSPRIFFVLLYRADEVDEAHPLRHLLSTQMRRGNAEEMRLKRLKEDEVQLLLMKMAGHNVRTSFAEEIYKYTEGNPFFIGEFIRSLIEEGKIKRTGDRWLSTVALGKLALPQSVRLVIERRLEHLSPECRVTLAYAAVLGRQFNSTLLCHARNLSEESIAEHVDDAIRTQILQTIEESVFAPESVPGSDADLSFTHDKIREVLALWLNPLRRRTAHRQIAQTIESHYAARLPVYYNKLAYHYQLAEETARAVEYLQKAATHAISVYAFVDAASFLEKAVELLLGEEKRLQRAELLRKLSVDVYLYVGQPAKAIEAGIAACTLWQELGEPVKEAECRLDVSFSFHWMGRETQAIEYIKRALDCLASVPQEKRLLARAHVQWGLAATISGTIPLALEHLHLSDQLHAEVGGNDPFISVVGLWARSWCASAGGTLQQMLDYALESAAICRTIRMFAWEPMMTYSAAWALMLMGRLEEGAETARAALEEARLHNAVGAQGWSNLVLSFLAIQQGLWERAGQFGDKAAVIAEMMHETGLLARVYWSRSICAGWQEKWEDAVKYILEALDIAVRDGELSLVHPYLLLQSAKAHFFAGHVEGAQHYLDQTMIFAQEQHYRQLPAIGQRIQGRILQAQSRFAEASDYFERSLRALTELDDPVEYARTQEAYGLFFLTRKGAGDEERGLALLQEARTTFTRLGVNG